jgi:hypothetical protein
VVTEPRGAVAQVEYDGGSITLCGDGTGRITGLPLAVWEFSVSGYRLVPRWLEARVGLPADLGLFAEADEVLQATLNATLTREVLDIGAGGQEANDR